MTETKYQLKLGAISFGVVVVCALAVELFWSNPISAAVLRTAAGVILNGLLTGFGFFAATLLWAVVSPRESDGFGGAGLVMWIFGYFGSMIGGCSGIIIGLFALSTLFAAIVGAITYLICFFKLNGLEGRIIPTQTRFKLIMLILIPGIVSAFSGALTARLIDHPFFR